VTKWVADRALGDGWWSIVASPKRYRVGLGAGGFGGSALLCHFALWLAVGWVMTFLDTFDKARARVAPSTQAATVRSQPRLLHPPLWYLARRSADPEGA
jgi:hypothetical protein